MIQLQKNLSAINHENFSKLYELTNNYNKATLLDKFIYWWQVSTFTLPNSPDIWFTRSRERIAAESKLSLRSIDRYLNEFVKEGFIEKTNKLFIKKHLYIRITDKLLHLLGLSTNEMTSPTNAPVPSIFPSTTDHENSNEQQKCVNLNQDGKIDFANLAVSIYKDQDNKINNSTVNNDHIVNNFENKKEKAKNTTQYPQYLIEKTIGEQLSPQFKNYIKGTLSNLQKQHNIKFSSPEQLFAEVVFSVLNKKHQFIGIEDNVHRMNLIAKLLRQNKWKTPKGFFNHSEIGKKFIKSTNKSNLMKQELLKREEGTVDNNDICTQPLSGVKKQNNAFSPEIKQVEREFFDIKILIQYETRYLNEMINLNQSKPSAMTDGVIQSIRSKLSQLNKTCVSLQEKLDVQKTAA